MAQEDRTSHVATKLKTYSAAWRRENGAPTRLAPVPDAAVVRVRPGLARRTRAGTHRHPERRGDTPRARVAAGWPRSVSRDPHQPWQRPHSGTTGAARSVRRAVRNAR